MDKKEILITLRKLLNQKFGIDIKKLEEENENIPLLSEFWGLSPLDLVYFILEIEKIYGIKLTTDDLINYGCDRISRIADKIQKTVHN